LTAHLKWGDLQTKKGCLKRQGMFKSLGWTYIPLLTGIMMWAISVSYFKVKSGGIVLPSYERFCKKKKKKGKNIYNIYIYFF